ncbi:MAG: selenium cofactor biosynthesis protein YqeC [Chloroflexi bacterium]|nr:selenium cofactor biosynthesis protein YqeC [Chloroflexota bacterium]MCL5076486.1 selenium cofactor biosynthesis protein YqeC [Chloroflexota bacterium]
MSLVSALNVSDGEVISFTGAGGKTTVMFRLARELVEQGKRVITTTTTAIYEPTLEESDYLLLAERPEEMLRLIREGLRRYHSLTVATGYRSEGQRRKLQSLDPSLIAEIAALPEVSNVLVEADGAAGHLIKAPAAYEPVIPPCSGLVVFVVAVGAIGKPLTPQVAHRLEQVMAVTGLSSGCILSAEAVAKLIIHMEGGAKGLPPGSRYVPFINMVEDEGSCTIARQVAALVLESGLAERVVFGSARGLAPIEVVLSSYK